MITCCEEVCEDFVEIDPENNFFLIKNNTVEEKKEIVNDLESREIKFEDESIIEKKDGEDTVENDIEEKMNMNNETNIEIGMKI